MNDITIRIDNEADWAEVLKGNVVIRRCHADSELIDTLTEIVEDHGATIERTVVRGGRV